MAVTTWIIAGAVACAIAAWLWWRKKKAEDEEPPKEGITMLLAEPRALNAQVLAALFADEFDVPVGTSEESEEVNFVLGEKYLFVVHLSGFMFMLHNNPKPYADNPEDVAKAHSDLRIAHIIRQQRGWLAMDMILQSGEQTDPYPVIGRALARLWGDDVKALYHPRSGRMVPSCDEVPALLRQSDPVEAVFSRSTIVPVIPIENEEAELLAAQQAAMARWDEFHEAFRANSEGCSVKAPITVGETTEHIWIEVTAIEENIVRGKLGNEPAALEGLRYGSRVEVPVAEIEDWVYLKDDKPVGAFSLEFFMKRKC